MIESFTWVPQALAQVNTTIGETAVEETFSEILLASVRFFVSLGIALGILVGSWIFAKILSHFVVSKLRDARGETIHEDAVVLVHRMITVGVMAVGVGVAFQFVLKIDILQIIGFLGLGVGFAFKDILSNLLAGVIILMQGRFHIGDFIQIKNFKGRVVEIQTRATILKGIDGTEIIIPNADFLSSAVTSFTTNPTRRINIAVGVHYNTDTMLASEIIKQVIESNEYVLKKPKPTVIAKTFGDSSIGLEARFWVESRGDKSWVLVKSDIVHTIRVAFEQHGITIPFPIRTIHQGGAQDGTQWKNINHGLGEQVDAQDGGVMPQGDQPVVEEPAAA